ncbi:MAG TPA: hypothetical protein VNH83_12665 [Bryobacteraceae bacterium]|nr:hypothetical protein [Bryobacteraceae bacterium]
MDERRSGDSGFAIRLAVVEEFQRETHKRLWGNGQPGEISKMRHELNNQRQLIEALPTDHDMDSMKSRMSKMAGHIDEIRMSIATARGAMSAASIFWAVSGSIIGSLLMLVGGALVQHWIK